MRAARFTTGNETTNDGSKMVKKTTVLNFSSFSAVPRRTALQASAGSKEWVFSPLCVKDHGLWWDAAHSCSPCLCPLVTSQQAAGTELLCGMWGNAVPTPPVHSEAISFFPNRWV